MRSKPKGSKPGINHPDNRPEVNKEYEDSMGRKLLVERIDEKRGVIFGKVHKPGMHPPAPYSCVLKDWQEIWDAKTPPPDPGKMKIG